MDWALAIDRNREALLRVIAAMVALVGMAESVSVSVLPRHVHLRVLRLLRPAESAVRRLVVILERDVTVTPRAPRPAPKPGAIPKRRAGRVPAFRLIDRLQQIAPQRRKYARGPGPQIIIIGIDEPVFYTPPKPPEPEDLIAAGQVCRRLASLQNALENLDAQAKRLARWRLRTAKKDGPKRHSPMRPGWPPGHLKRPTHEVHEVLRDCHELAVLALKPPDPV